MALGCERVEEMLEGWNILVTAKCTIYVLLDSAGNERRFLTGLGAPRLGIFNWNIFDRRPGSLPVRKAYT